MNREELMAAMAADRGEITPVEVPGWGTVHVRDMTVAMVDKLNAARKKQGEAAVGVLAASAASIICDEKGAYLFDPANPDDISFLSALGFSKLGKLLAAGNALQENTPGN